jgi:lysophospholipase L1-like esterase
MSKPYFTRGLVIFLCLLSLIVVISGCSTSRELSYVALGDSIPGGWGVGYENYAEYFADYLQQDLDASVEFHNYARAGDRTYALLDRLQDDTELRQAVADANAITIWIGVNDLPTPQMLYMNGMCGGEENLDCIRERIGEINENIDGILDEILALNSSKETRIMIADNAIPLVFVTDWKNHGCFDVLQEEVYESWHDHLYQAARERGIIVVPTYHAINGPSGDQGNDGLYQDDGLHFNVEGHRLIADIHREAWK